MKLVHSEFYTTSINTILQYTTQLAMSYYNCEDETWYREQEERAIEVEEYHRKQEEVN
jgi:hypothetical protein